MIARLFAPLAMKIATGFALMFLVGFTAQTIRIEGLGFLHVGYKEQVKVLRLDLDNIKAAQIAAKAIAEAERLRIEAEYREQAEKIDEQYKDRLASANARADAYARGCGPKPLTVYPAQSEPPPKITPPKALTDPVRLPSYLSPAPTLISSTRTPSG